MGLIQNMNVIVGQNGDETVGCKCVAREKGRELTRALGAKYKEIGGHGLGVGKGFAKVPTCIYCYAHVLAWFNNVKCFLVNHTIYFLFVLDEAKILGKLVQIKCYA